MRNGEYQECDIAAAPIGNGVAGTRGRKALSDAGGQDDYSGATELASRVITISDLTLVKDWTVGQLWGEALRRGAVTELVGDAGVGKTTFNFNLAAALARGGSFLGIDTGGPLSVLYIDYETPGSLRGIKWDTVTLGDRSSAPVLLPDPLPEPPLSSNWLISIIKQYEISVVFIDTVSLAIPVQNENDPAEVSRQVRAMKLAASETDAALLFTHHAPKGATQRGMDYAYIGRGSSAREANADIVLSLRRALKGHKGLDLVLHKSRWCSAQTIIHLRQMGNDQFEPIASHEAKQAGKVTEVLDFAIQFVCDQGTAAVATSDIVQAGDEKGFKKRTIERALETARKDGLLVQQKQGQWLHSKFSGYESANAIAKPALREREK